MNDLALIEITNPLIVFSTPKGLDAIIDKIEAEVKTVDRDISTEAGRDNIRSIAFKIAKSKTALDKMGKDLTEEQRKQIDAVNAERSRAWDRMEALQKEIRKPLTDWEDAEKKRVDDHEAGLLHIESLGVFADTPTTQQIEARIKEFSVLAPRVWQEFEPRYNYAVKTLSDNLAARLAESQKRDSETAELERLRREEIERKKKEHEERIAAEATKAAEEKAAAEAEAAVQRERERVEAVKKAEEAETARREADKEHRKKINNEALTAIHKLIQDWSGSVEKDNGEEAAKAIVSAIAKNEIPHVKIGY